jgi:hypothetical protein
MTSTKKRKRDEDGVAHELDAEAAVTTVNDWVEDMPITTDTAGTTLDLVTSGTQTPASSVDLDIIRRIDPRLLLDGCGQNWKRLKSHDECLHGSF